MNPASNTERSGVSMSTQPSGQQPSSIYAPTASNQTPSMPPLGTNYGQAPVLSTNSTQTPTPAIATTPLPVAGIVPSTTNMPTPQLADDSDLIEKEWVDKAKRIVQANLENPYEQSRELTSLKADYMKKRYNKDIRLGE
jgi:hypothetical protein